MDTEFPGVVASAPSGTKSSSDYQYQLLRCNVDLLKIYSWGFTFSSTRTGRCRRERVRGSSTSSSTWARTCTRRRAWICSRTPAYSSNDMSGKALRPFICRDADSSGIVLLDNVKWLSSSAATTSATSQHPHYILRCRGDGVFRAVPLDLFPNITRREVLNEVLQNLKGTARGRGYARGWENRPSASRFGLFTDWSSLFTQDAGDLLLRGRARRLSKYLGTYGLAQTC